MSVVQSSVHSFLRMFEDKTQDFIHDIENVHMVWLEEIQQAANIMFSRDFNSEPELMPKTPSQKKNTRRKRVSVGRQEEGQVRRRFSKGRRSNLRGSSVTPLDIVVEEANASAAKRSTSTRPNRTTRTKKQTKVEIAEDEQLLPHVSYDSIDECNKKAELVEDEAVHNNCEVDSTNIQPDVPCDARQSEIKIPSPGVVVSIPASERLSAEQATKPQLTQSPGRTAAKIAIAGNSRSSRRSSVKCSLKVRHSLSSLRHSMTRESLRRASRKSMLKKNATRKDNSSYSSNIDAASSCESMEEMDEVASEAVTANPEVAVTGGSDDSPQTQTAKSGQPSLARVTRSVAANSPKLAPPSLFTPERNYLQKRTMFTDTQQTLQASQRSTKNIKRQAAETTAESPVKRCTPPKRSRSAVRPNMKSFLHTVQKNQMLMMSQSSFNRNSVMKSFIKTTTPLKIDPKAKELQKLEALKKKQEQEEERMRKMEEEKKKKQEELKRKRDERLRKVYEAKVKEEQREEEKKKKIEQKMAHIDEKNDKRQAAEMAKKRIAIKRQEDLEQKRKLEEETKRKKNQQAERCPVCCRIRPCACVFQPKEEEKRQQEFLARKATEEELKAKKLAEARRALELKREQERERELERERVAAAESERVEKEKALALQRELARAAREKERLDLEEKRQKEEQQRLAAEEKAAKDKEAAAKQVANAKTAAALNVTVEIERSVMSTPAAKGSSLNITVDIEKSPQSYSITPNGGSKTLTLTNNLENYGMDQNSDDSTDDESDPRKPIPSWAEGPKLQQIIMKQYFNPPDLDSFFGPIEPPKLENLFYKSKPRYFKRTSSAVWHSPPNVNKH
ncbi:inner centromere protein isoform X2 [Phyllopteryx taeniolatus]|uniref:inner centromere protein isoform X2 n=1 Tax=Phyllopteryx taeniolatus TaxID=161469 RepID=UPI002AD47141|nr:inner centromere protein isoform X2 [Phyllopteryx taeniolatus]